MAISQKVARAVWSAAAALKNAIVSDRPRYVKVLFGPARGATLYTSARHATRTILGLYESELVPYLARYVHPGDVCYDIGAADGYYGFAFARLAAPGDVRCCDADEHGIERLEELLDRNAHLGSTLSAHRLTIGAAHVDHIHTCLDALVFEQAWRPPNVIKIDVEGDEVRVLEGATQVLTTHHPRLIIEVHSPQLEAACRDLLADVGYSVTLVENRPFMAEGAFRQGHNRWICAE